MSTLTRHYKYALKRYTQDRAINGNYSKNLLIILKRAQKVIGFLIFFTMLITAYEVPSIDLKTNIRAFLFLFFINCAGLSTFIHILCISTLVQTVHVINTNTNNQPRSIQGSIWYMRLGYISHISAMSNVIGFFGLLTYGAYTAQE